MSRYSRTKGANFENTVRKLIARVLELDWKRDITRTRSGSGQPLRDLTVRNIDFPYRIECRKQERWDFHELFKHPEKATLVKWFKELLSSSVPGLDEMLVFAKNRSPIYCCQAKLSFSMLNHLRVQLVSGPLWIHRFEDFLKEWKIWNKEETNDVQDS